MDATVQCCVAGGGPAGVMVGYLLARAGIRTLILEKHKDFLRDFRGDTVHASTLEVIYELGLLDEFLKRPHQELREIRGRIGGVEVRLADLTHLPTHCRFIALMPQWDFLNFLAEQGKKFPAFQLLMEAEVTSLIEKDGRIVGVEADTEQGRLKVKADLVIAADGRNSNVRKLAGLEVEDLGAPIDVLWMRISKKAGDPRQVLGYFNRGRVLVMLDRGDYWQCAFLILKGQFDEIRAEGLPHFREEIAGIAPFLKDRVTDGEPASWDDVNLLSVRVDRLHRWWRPGLLCIGDSAHAMSPIGGVGINLAIQDAVAAANILAGPWKAGGIADKDLEAVQERRMFPAKATQAFQVFVHKRVLERVLGRDKPLSPPWPVRLLDRWALLRRIPARFLGLGVRPEHVRSGTVPE
jgi:2-polyprenyl-6-methoxyphenol hydroxylase-like FAD-dependent oxidoreductase